MLVLPLLLLLTGPSDPPVARIDFPLPSALTNAGTMRVRGRASDPDGVATVRVNGVLASTVDGYAHWSAVVPLGLGDNVLQVETADMRGNLDPAAASTTVRRDGAIVRRPQGLALDPASDTCFVFDWVPDGAYLTTRTRILAVDLSTGALEVVSSASMGTGPLPRYATGEMEFDALGHRLLLLDLSFNRLIAVDVMTGDRTVISGDGVGAGPVLQNAIGLELDAAGDRAWVVNRSFGPDTGAVLSVDLASGDRSVVSGPGVGSGPWPESQTWMTRLGDSQRLLVACYQSNLLLGINLTTGERSIVSDGSLGLGTPWELLWDVAAPESGRAWVGSVGDGRLFSLDLASGAHAEVAPPAPDDPRKLFDIELDPARGRLLAADDQRSAILSMELTGDDLEVMVRNSIGSGTPFRRTLVGGTAVDRSGRTWMVDHQHGELIAIEPATGVRTLVSGGGAGSGPELIQPVRIGIDERAGTGRAIVIDTGLQAVVAIDLVSGARSLLSGAGFGSGPPINFPAWSGSSLDVAAGAAWLIDGVDIFSPEDRLMRIDLTSGERTIVSGEGIGVGPALVNCTGMAVDFAGGRALTFSFDDLLTIDLASGDRSLLSSDLVGAGPTFGDPVLIEWDAHGQRALVYGRMAGITAVDGASGDRERLAESSEILGPGLAWPTSMDLWRRGSDGEPLLFLGDHELTALTVLDLARDPVTGFVPAWRTIVAR